MGDKGIILIDTVIGAKPPLRYSLNNGQSFTAQNFFANLNPGDYTILVRDANGCETTVQATVNEPQVFEITLEPRVTIHLGESYQIETTVNLPASALSQILWTPATGLDCDTCLNPLAIPLITTQYRVTVFSNAGCKDDAALLLIVDRRPDVYIPNIFHPTTTAKTTCSAFMPTGKRQTGQILPGIYPLGRTGDRIFQLRPQQPRLWLEWYPPRATPEPGRVCLLCGDRVYRRAGDLV
ncbi:MAG: hypothetical protein IPH12_20935 [Saprospirales bacterium]|nr:hypothetical protein [Saprospirales bacterium]